MPPSKTENQDVVELISRHAHRFKDLHGLQPLFELIGDAKVVMLGEASHGTHEYYTWRTAISRKLIEEKGFNFIAVEGDWPDCYRLNRFIKGYEGGEQTALNVVKSFNRWPTWMWANWEVAALAEWMHGHNAGHTAENKVGFFGLDVYSLWESMESIMSYLRTTDPSALDMVEEAFRCFEPYRRDEGESYARATMFVPDLCRNEVAELLSEIRMKVTGYPGDPENAFDAEQNAYIAVNAEKYYHAMIQGGPESWNIRDSHMHDTLERLLRFHGPDAKAIVWAHNTHIGDARATDMADEGMHNLGQLARQQFSPGDVVLVGMGSYAGSVTAGHYWGAPVQAMELPDAQAGSWESLLHRVGNDNKLLLMDDLRSNERLRRPIDHRAVGVVYQPEREHLGNFVPSVIPERYDAFIYLDQTQALHPLHVKTDPHLVPETFPFGL